MARLGWKSAEETLFHASRAMIQRFAAEHPDKVFADGVRLGGPSVQACLRWGTVLQGGDPSRL
ncbi:unnamed protein product [uncultured bacterium]|nr:unnamed protein product [uncultured bacterium]